MYVSVDVRLMTIDDVYMYMYVCVWVLQIFIYCSGISKCQEYISFCMCANCCGCVYFHVCIHVRVYVCVRKSNNNNKNSSQPNILCLCMYIEKRAKIFRVGHFLFFFFVVVVVCNHQFQLGCRIFRIYLIYAFRRTSLRYDLLSSKWWFSLHFHRIN